MKSVAFFNNKGGVGKTTLACNMAAHLRKETDAKILVIDLDPQCNATQLLLSEDQWDEIYSNRKESPNESVMKVLRYIRQGDSHIDADFPTAYSERFEVHVLPGHPSLSVVEDQLSSSWVEFKGGTIGGARRTLWVRRMVEAAHAYDYVFLDVGPSLGALNRTTLMGADGFVTPMAADLFSLYALDNIGSWMKTWCNDYRKAYESIGTNDSPAMEELTPTLPVENGFLGYTVQQYVSRAKGGTLRSVKAYEQYREQIPERASDLADMSRLPSNNLNLGLVPNMFAMVPLAQSVHSPILALTPADGVRGAQVSQRERYLERLTDISTRLIRNLKEAGIDEK